MPSKLNVFDFDGTLFKSPEDTPENRLKYERATGIPWVIDKEASTRLTKQLGRFVPMRRGWWGKGETLEPPLVPSPAPAEWFVKDVCEALKASKADEHAVTLIMTGRHAGLKNQVMRILHEGKLAEVKREDSKSKGVFYRWADAACQIKFLGDDGPLHGRDKPGETFPWKVWVMEQYVTLHPEIALVEIWEDRDEHAVKFRELDGVLAERVVIRHVKAG